MSFQRFMFSMLTIAGGTAFNHGFQAAFLNVAARVFHNWCDEIMQFRGTTQETNTMFLAAFMVSGFSCGAIFGSLLIYVGATYIGRKPSLLAHCVLVIFGLFCIALSYVVSSYEIFIFGRFTLGICAGFGSGIAPMYLVEISPDCLRGTAGSFYNVMVAFSTFVAYVFGMYKVFGKAEEWHILFWLSFIPAIGQFISLFFIPESPKFLYLEQKSEDDGEEATMWFRGESEEYTDELEEEAQLLEEIGTIDLERIFNDQTLRSPLIIIMALLIGQRFCGGDILLYFSTAIFTNFKYSEDQANTTTILLGLVYFVSTIVSMVLTDRIGRRPLFLISFIGMFLCLIGIFFSLALAQYAELRLLKKSQVFNIGTMFIFFHIICYGLGSATVSWYYAPELCNQMARASSVMWAVTFNWIANFIAVLFSAILIYIAGHYLLVISVCFTLFNFLFGFLTIRETKMMAAVDIAELFYE